MKKKIIPILGIALVCACNKNNTDDIIDVRTDDTGVPVSFMVISEATKAAEISTLDRINISCSTGSAGVSEVEKWTLSGLSVNGGKVQTGKYWPATDEKYIFYASNQAMTPGSKGPEINVNSDTDCLVARNLTPRFKEANTLTFNHILSRIVGCSVSGPGDYQLSNAKLDFIPVATGKYNCGTQEYTRISNGSKVNLVSAAGEKNGMDIWTLPGEYVLTASYKLTKGDWTKSYTTTKTLTLLPGKRHRINASFSIPQDDEAAAVDFNIEIIDWENQTTDITL